MKNNRGFSILELLLFVVIGVVFLAFVGNLFLKCSGASFDHSVAEKEAKEWAAQMEVPKAKINCVNLDSDGDGYVSCTVSYKLDTGKIEIIPIECSGSFRLNSGCRQQKLAGVGR